jgi:large subunit ribosomal protein L14
MKQISANQTKGITTKTQCVCADNSGAKIVEVISVFKSKTRNRQLPSAGIASLVNVVVKKGTPSTKKKIEKAVVVRVKKEYRRKNGVRICFEDNAVVLTDNKGLPKASEVKGCVAKEVGERYSKIAGLASSVV